MTTTLPTALDFLAVAHPMVPDNAAEADNHFTKSRRVSAMFSLPCAGASLQRLRSEKLCDAVDLFVGVALGVLMHDGRRLGTCSEFFHGIDDVRLIQPGQQRHPAFAVAVGAMATSTRCRPIAPLDVLVRSERRDARSGQQRRRKYDALPDHGSSPVKHGCYKVSCSYTLLAPQWRRNRAVMPGRAGRLEKKPDLIGPARLTPLRRVRRDFLPWL